MEEKTKYILALFIVAVIFSVFIYQISMGPQEITGQEKAEVLQYADPVSDNLLRGFNEGNHTMLSRDFDEQMKNAFTEDVFLQSRELIVSKIGMYVSRQSPAVIKQGPFISVIYEADFEKEKGVRVSVVFLKYGEKNLVSGLWFNSPKLRE